MKLLSRIARAIDKINESVGRFMSWAVVLLVLIQFVIVIMRYVFGVGSIMMQESLTYLHASLFMLAAGYTLLHQGHVRVDIFYRGAHPHTRAKVDLFGSLLLLLPVCIATWWTAWPYVMASWATHEGSRETSGIQAIYLLKTVILAFAILVALQGISLAIHSFHTLVRRETLPEGKAPRF